MKDTNSSYLEIAEQIEAEAWSTTNQKAARSIRMLVSQVPLKNSRIAELEALQAAPPAKAGVAVPAMTQIRAFHPKRPEDDGKRWREVPEARAKQLVADNPGIYQTRQLFALATAQAQEHAAQDSAVEWAGYKPLLASAIAAKDAMLARGIRYDRFDPMFAEFLAKVDAAHQEHATQLAGQGHEIEIIRQLVDHIERNTCEHHETYRGGAIWEICSGCGAKWADDEGGKPEFQWAESVERARAFLLSTNKAHKDEQA